MRPTGGSGSPPARSRELAVGATSYRRPTSRRSTSRSGRGVAYVTSGDSGTFHVQDLDGRVLRTTPVPIGSYNVQYGFGRVLTASLARGTLAVLDRHGGCSRVVAGRRLVPRRLLLPTDSPERFYESLTGSQVDLETRRGTWALNEAPAPRCRCSPLLRRPGAGARGRPVPRQDLQRLVRTTARSPRPIRIACYVDALQHIPLGREDLLEPRARTSPPRCARRSSTRRARSCRSRSATGSRRTTCSRSSRTKSRRTAGAARLRRSSSARRIRRRAARPPMRRWRPVEQRAPLPVLVLGGLALALVAAGAIGAGVKHARLTAPLSAVSRARSAGR